MRHERRRLLLPARGVDDGGGGRGEYQALGHVVAAAARVAVAVTVDVTAGAAAAAAAAAARVAALVLLLLLLRHTARQMAGCGEGGGKKRCCWFRALPTNLPSLSFVHLLVRSDGLVYACRTFSPTI